MNDVKDNQTISRSLIIGWLAGHKVAIAVGATTDEIFAELNKLIAQSKAAAVAENASRNPALGNDNTNPIQPTLDISKLSPADFMEVHRHLTEKIQHESGCDLSTALARVKIFHPEIAARLKSSDVVVTGYVQSSPKVIGLGNAEIPSFPVFAPQINALLHLPPDATQAESEAAWKGTDGVLTPLNTAGIWKMLFALTRGKLAGSAGGRPVADATVEFEMRKRFPQLATEILGPAPYTTAPAS